MVRKFCIFRNQCWLRWLCGRK